MEVQWLGQAYTRKEKGKLLTSPRRTSKSLIPLCRKPHVAGKAPIRRPTMHYYRYNSTSPSVAALFFPVVLVGGCSVQESRRRPLVLAGNLSLMPEKSQPSTLSLVALEVPSSLRRTQQRGGGRSSIRWRLGTIGRGWRLDEVLD